MAAFDKLRQRRHKQRKSILTEPVEANEGIIAAFDKLRQHRHRQRLLRQHRRAGFSILDLSIPAVYNQFASFFIQYG